MSMIDSVLELRLTQNGPIASGGNVVFNDPIQGSKAISYNAEKGIITFNEIGQYSIKWWIATETTLSGTIGFELQLEQDNFISGCSPVKTGQVSGFGIIDVKKPETTLTLVNKSETSTMVSRKTLTKGHLLIMPIVQSPIRIYRGNISEEGSHLEAPLGNGLYYRLEYLNATELRLVLVPMNGTTLYDYRRFSSFNGTVGLEGSYSDNATLSQATTVDSPIYDASREMHWTLIRVMDPLSQLWSTYEVRFFVSGGKTRATIWVNVIEEEVSY